MCTPLALFNELFPSSRHRGEGSFFSCPCRYSMFVDIMGIRHMLLIWLNNQVLKELSGSVVSSLLLFLSLCLEVPSGVNTEY